VGAALQAAGHGSIDKALTRFWRKKTVKRTLQKSVKFLPIPS
jgi:hypothetical protein